MRKLTIALAAVLALAAGSVSTGALARGGHGGGGHMGGGHMGGGHMGGGHMGGGTWRRHMGAAPWALISAVVTSAAAILPSAAVISALASAAASFSARHYAYYGYSACYQRRPVPTPYGLVWARVWVCG